MKKGDFLSIMGPSGCGKSTLLNVIGLLDQPGTGSVQVDGAPVKTYKDKDVAKLRNRTFGFIFQQFHLVKGLSAIDNVMLPAYPSGERHAVLRVRREAAGWFRIPD